MPALYDLAALQDAFKRKAKLKYVFFWGHTPKQKGIADKAVFSQWYPAAFEVDGERYATAEHYMMAEKARLFGADGIRRQILQAGSPKQAKALGRQIVGFKDEVWNAHRFDIVCRANFAKFSQHADLKAFLLQTGNRILVEASPVDSIWGIGSAQDDPHAENPLQWQGLNLLGFALMKVRDQMQAACNTPASKPILPNFLY